MSLDFFNFFRAICSNFYLNRLKNQDFYLHLRTNLLKIMAIMEDVVLTIPLQDATFYRDVGSAYGLVDAQVSHVR